MPIRSRKFVLQEPLESPTVITPLLDDSDLGITITSANQTGATPVATLPDVGDNADTFVMKDTQQTVTNKVLTTPVIPSIYQDTGKTKLMTLPNVSSDTLVGAGAEQTLALKTLTTPIISTFYKDAGKTKLMTVPDVASDTVALLGAEQTMLLKSLTTPIVASAYQDAGKTNLVTMPAATDTLVGKATTDTLTNKTLTSPKINEDVALARTATELNKIVQQIGFNMPLKLYRETNTLTISNCDTIWADNAWRTYAGVASLDAVAFKVGTYGAKCVTSSAGGGIHLVKTIDFTKAEDGISVLTTADFLEFYFTIDATSFGRLDANGIRVVVPNDVYGTGDNFFYATIDTASLVSGEQFISIPLTDFSVVGAPAWDVATGISIGLAGTPTGEITTTVDAVRFTRKDPDSATSNPCQRNINGTWVADATPDATANFFLGNEITAEYDDLTFRNLSPQDDIYGELVYKNLYTDFYMSSKLTALTATYLYSGLGFKIDSDNMMFLIINTDVMYLITKTGGAAWVTTLYTTFVVAENDEVMFELVKVGTSVIARARIKSGAWVYLTTTFTPTGAGSMATPSLAAASQNLNSMAVTATSHANTCNIAECAKVADHIVLSLGGMSAYEKTVDIGITDADQYFAVYSATASDFVANALNEGFTFNEGRVVDADITSEADNTVVRIVTSGAHALTTGDIVNITNAENAAHNGATRVDVIDATTFDCRDITYVANAGNSTAKVVEPAYLQANAETHGVYHIIWQASASAAVAVKVYKIEPVVNVTHIDEAVSESVATGTIIQAFAGQAPALILPGDRIWFQVMNKTDGNTITLTHFNGIVRR